MNRWKISLLGISMLGLASITQYEGFRENAYLDVGGVPTIGYGSTENVHIGDRIDENGATRRLISDLMSEYHPAINNCIEVPLNQFEYDAYISLTYNIGSNAFCKSTLVKLLNQGKYTEACEQILKWNKVKGRIIPGLVNRREKEYKMCLGDINVVGR